VAEAIRKTQYENLYVIPCGASTPNPLELLSSSKFKNILAELSSKFDRIILDTPPGFLIPDALVLSQLANATIFVTKAGTVNADALSKMKKKFSVSNTKLIGIVLNFFNMKEHLHYQTDYYHRYYNKYYKKYYADKKDENHK